MSHISKVIAGLKPAFLMVVVQVAYAGVSILYKMVANDGMSLSVLMAYRFLFASAFIVPLAYFVERFHNFVLNHNVYLFLKVNKSLKMIF